MIDKTELEIKCEMVLSMIRCLERKERNLARENEQDKNLRWLYSVTKRTPVKKYPSSQLIIEKRPLPWIKRTIPRNQNISPEQWANINTGKTWIYISTCSYCKGYGCFHCDRTGKERNVLRSVLVK